MQKLSSFFKFQMQPLLVIFVALFLLAGCTEVGVNVVSNFGNCPTGSNSTGTKGTGADPGACSTMDWIGGDAFDFINTETGKKITDHDHFCNTGSQKKCKDSPGKCGLGSTAKDCFSQFSPSSPGSNSGSCKCDCK